MHMIYDKAFVLPRHSSGSCHANLKHSSYRSVMILSDNDGSFRPAHDEETLDFLVIAP